MENQIYYIDPPLLQDEQLWWQLREDTSLTYYWSDNWTPSFYATLAYEGFISVTLEHDEYGLLLLPELQESYALLDWQNLHVSKKVRRLVGNLLRKENSVVVRLSHSLESVVSGIGSSFGGNCWLHEKYLHCLQQARDKEFLDVVAIEMLVDGELVAGEVGYFIGATYTSLSGFFNREDHCYANMGTLQLILLAKVLERAGIHFWNLGHPQLEYKTRLGAAVVPRREFLQRWYVSRDVDTVYLLQHSYTLEELWREVVNK